MATRPLKTLKDPVCLLMEYAAKTKLKVDFTEPAREGPDHSPRFVVASCIDGRLYPYGTGSNKKTAKKEAAKIAYRTLLGENLQTTNGVDNGDLQNGYDSDDNGTKDPVSELMEHAHVVKETVDFTPVSREGPDHRPVFCTSAIVGGKRYPQGCAGTKKQAKKEAAQKALDEIGELRNGSRSPISDSSSESGRSVCSVDGKHPTSALMEFAQARGIQVTFLPPTVEGPDHIRRYETAVIINGHILPIGTGVSIKEAKKEAAYKAMELLKNQQYLAKLLRTSNSPVSNGNTGADKPAPTTYTPIMLSILEEFSDKDPICALQEYCVPRRLNVNYIEHPATGPSHQPTFGISCTVDGRVFPTQVSNQKQTSKKEAARIALATILSEAQKALTSANKTAAREIQNTLNNVSTEWDYMAALSHKILEIVQNAQRDKFVKEKVLATIILKMGKNDKGTVVSLGTGNRCILGKHLTKDGKKVHHSHAEVIARRGFLRYLYAQLKSYRKGFSHDLFEESHSGITRLKLDVSVHLYISRPPCGDASAFIDISNNPSKQRASRRQGLLRTIMEDGEGAIPCISEPDAASYQQLQIGEKRLRVMTCSDKICRWNVLGIQGALLSRFMDPIYLTSVTVGSYRGQQLQHLPRALFGRLVEKNKGEFLANYLPKPFRINRPVVGNVTNSSSEVYDLANSREFSINWCIGDPAVEVVDGMSGERIVGQGPEAIPRVSKFALAELFTDTLKRQRRLPTAQWSALTYLDVKDKCPLYQEAKKHLIDWLLGLNYGPWIHLPDEVDSFDLICNN